MSITESPICDHPPEQPHGNEDEIEQEGVPDLEDVFVEAGALGDMKAALEKAKALKAMLASGLPSKVCSTSPVVGQNQSAGVADRCSVSDCPGVPLRNTTVTISFFTAPPQTEEDMRKELEVVEEKAKGIQERLQVNVDTVGPVAGLALSPSQHQHPPQGRWRYHQ